MSRTPCIEDYGTPSLRTVVVTGPRFWIDLNPGELSHRVDLVQEVLQDELHVRGNFTLVHGNAKGLDRIAAAEWQRDGGECIAVPYFGWLRGAGGPARNTFMLTTYGPEIVHGFHDVPYEKLPQPGSGTADCVRQAIELSIPVTFHTYGVGPTTYEPRNLRLV